MSYLKKAYEISVWEDVWNGNRYTENKICVIGSDSMSSQNRVIEPQLTENTNGTKKLTFKLYKKYIDNTTGQTVFNPFADYLINERKVKLHYKNNWYEFFIKQISKNSSNYLYTYQLEDALVQELSKNGFSVELNEAINNNCDTAKVLAERVLPPSTGWNVQSDLIVQRHEESLVYVKLPQAAISPTIEAKRIIDSTMDTQDYSFAGGTVVLAFYSACIGRPRRFQFIYPISALRRDNNGIIVEPDCQYYIDFDNPDTAYEDKVDNYGFQLPKNWTTATYINNLSEDTLPVSCYYKGNRYGYTQKSIFHNGLNRYVSLWTDNNGKEVYSYEKTDYIAPILVTNYITNSKNYSSSDGWYPAKRSTNGLTITKVCGRFYNGFKPVETEPFNASTPQMDRDFYIQVKAPSGSSSSRYSFYNTGFTDNRLSIEISANDRFALRGDIYSSSGARIGITDNILGWSLAEGELVASGELQVEASPQITFSIERDKTKDIVYFTVNKNNYTKGTFKKNSTVKLICEIPAGQTLYFKNLELFRVAYDDNNNLIEPGTASGLGVAETRKVYFQIDGDSDNTINTKENDLITTVVTEPCVPVYYPNAEKVRAVDAKESNYFNILQSIAETFGVWLRIEATHNSLGQIISKTVKFRNYIGKENYAGFRYGVNLKENSRTEISKNIVTKLIVKDNKNQYAKNGFCSIGRAPLNEAGENTLYNFSYFYKSGLINEQDLKNYLYNGSDPIGKDIDPSATTWNAQNYFKRLKALNNQLDLINEQILGLSKEIVNYSANIELKTVEAESAEEEAANIAISFQKRFQTPINGAIPPSVQDSSEAQAMYVSWIEMRTKQLNSSAELTELQTAFGKITKDYDDLQSSAAQLIEYKRCLHEEFYKKFGRFINEGTWISEEYIDDNQYYVDSLSTLYHSCYPTAEYSLKVSSVDALPGYESYTFEIGDQTYVEDEEFFGTTDRIDVVVTETTVYLDDPTKDSIKIQNFKNQFQDLFQKITATVQQAQYKTGSYDKAAQLVDSSAEDRLSFVEEAFENEDAAILIGGQATVIQNKSGLCIRDIVDPFNELRLLGGKILISRRDEDGKQKWSLGLSSQGLSADLINAGTLNAGKIMIMDNDEPAFRWDKHGVTALEKTSSGYNVKKFVRFDRHGLYGIDSTNLDGTTWVPTDEDEIAEKSAFQLTWNGLKITGGKVRVENNNTENTNNESSNNESLGTEVINDTPTYKEVVAILGKQGNKIFSVTNGNETIFEILNNGTIRAKGLEVIEGTFTGEISAGVGAHLAGWDVSLHSLTTGTLGTDGYHMYASDYDKGAWFGATDTNTQWALGIGKNFGVTPDGAVYCTNIMANGGFIGGWKLDQYSLTTGDIGISDSYHMYAKNFPEKYLFGKTKNWALLIGQHFGVASDGCVYATGGKIGGWTLNAVSLVNGSFGTTGFHMFTSNYETGSWFGASSATTQWALGIGSNFGVTPSGALYCQLLFASGGNIGGWSIKEDRLTKGDIGKQDSFHMYTDKKASGALFGATTDQDWALGIGTNFGVTFNGSVYCQDLMATGGVIGPWELDEDGLQYNAEDSGSSFPISTHIGKASISISRRQNSITLQDGRIYIRSQVASNPTGIGGEYIPLLRFYMGTSGGNERNYYWLCVKKVYKQYDGAMNGVYAPESLVFIPDTSLN